MMRSHGAVAIALLALLPPAAADLPVRAFAAPTLIAFEPALSASLASDRALIAHHYAPIHYQEVDRDGENGLEGRADYITRIDFDGDWDAKNDWENASRFPLSGAAYHSVVETTSHWFVAYMFFHPRDWADTLLETEHENDAEGVLLAVRRDGSRFGRLQAAVTVAHSDFYSFLPSGSGWSAGAESVDGVLELDPGTGRPLTTQEAGGHALRTRRSERAFSGIVYYPSLVTGTTPFATARTAPYVLVDVFEPGGVWDRRDEPKLFSKRGTFAGDRGGACGSGAILCTADAANAPWGWDDGDDGDVRRGDMAIDPVRLVTQYFRIPERVSRAYTFNPYGRTARPEPDRANRVLAAETTLGRSSPAR